MCVKWIKDALEALPGTDDALFQNVCKKSRLLFDSRYGVSDIVDYHSARLIAATLRRGGRLLLSLPDFQPHRPAFLLATALIRHFLDSRCPVGTASKRNDKILYFGSSIGIREQLRRTSVQGLGIPLSQVFSQQDIHRGVTEFSDSVSPQASLTANLPHVITAYSPADPIGMLQTYCPCWIAIDCSDAPSMAWLQPLLKEAAQREIPVVAWGQNPLSECVNDFNSLGQTFTWPPNSPCILRGELDALLQSKDPIYMGPFVIYGKSSQLLSTSLSEAGHILSRATQHAASGGRLIKDTVAIHWKYLRSLESLAVPVDFYEAEAQRFWGLQSLVTLEAVCSRFRSVFMESDTILYQGLEAVAILLQQARNNIETMGCALWEALINLCLEDSENDALRILVFPSNSKKQLFLFAMLARRNTTEDDLCEMGKYVTSLTELRRWSHHSQGVTARDDDSILMPAVNKELHPILVGLPSPVMTPRLLYALLHPKVDIVLYPHQCSSFMRRQAEWSVCMSGNASHNISALACMSRIAKPPAMPISPERITVGEPVEMDVETTRKTRTTLAGSCWKPDDPVIEVARLFHRDSEFEGEELILNDQINTVDSTSESPEDIWCKEAVRVGFDQGWYAYFAPNDRINVISQGSLNLRYVRSLRRDERVLIIHGQKRQNLYDLIISRVHKHPSIELNLAMIRRWQDDLRVAFAQWCSCAGDPSELRAYGARDLNGLLRRIRSKGSLLVSSLTLNFWLKGLVLCPLQPEDLRRVSEVLNMGFVQKYYKRISQAASRLRGLHRGLSNKLNRWLPDQMTGAMQGNDDEIIDAELGLTFGDVKNSLLILHIMNVETLTGPFLISTLGRVEREV